MSTELDDLFSAFDAVLSDSSPSLIQSPGVAVEGRSEALEIRAEEEEREKAQQREEGGRVGEGGFGEHESDEDVFADLERELGLSLTSGAVTGSNTLANDTSLPALGALETIATTDLGDFARSLALETKSVDKVDDVTPTTKVEDKDSAAFTLNLSDSVNVIVNSSDPLPTPIGLIAESRPSLQNKDSLAIRSPVRDRFIP